MVRLPPCAPQLPRVAMPALTMPAGTALAVTMRGAGAWGLDPEPAPGVLPGAQCLNSSDSSV